MKQPAVRWACLLSAVLTRMCVRAALFQTWEMHNRQQPAVGCRWLPCVKGHAAGEGSRQGIADGIVMWHGCQPASHPACQSADLICNRSPLWFCSKVYQLAGADPRSRFANRGSPDAYKKNWSQFVLGHGVRSSGTSVTQANCGVGPLVHARQGRIPTQLWNHPTHLK